MMQREPQHRRWPIAAQAVLLLTVLLWSASALANKPLPLALDFGLLQSQTRALAGAIARYNDEVDLYRRKRASKSIVAQARVVSRTLGDHQKALIALERRYNKADDRRGIKKVRIMLNMIHRYEGEVEALANGYMRIYTNFSGSSMGSRHGPHRRVSKSSRRTTVLRPKIRRIPSKLRKISKSLPGV